MGVFNCFETQFATDLVGHADQTSSNFRGAIAGKMQMGDGLRFGQIRQIRVAPALCRFVFVVVEAFRTSQSAGLRFRN